MTVLVQFFSHLRDLVGTSQVEVELAEGATVSDLLEQLYHRFPALRQHDETILVGVDVEFVGRDFKLQSGAEIAVMPPVQGG